MVKLSKRIQGNAVFNVDLRSHDTMFLEIKCDVATYQASTSFQLLSGATWIGCFLANVMIADGEVTRDNTFTIQDYVVYRYDIIPGLNLFRVNTEFVTSCDLTATAYLF